MERKPEHLVEDPVLRAAFTGQVSWDEWALTNAPFFLHPDGRQIVEEHMLAMGMDAIYEDALSVAIQQWTDTLDPETNAREYYYLQGYTYDQRTHILEQQHADIVRRAVEMGIIEERPADQDFREQFGS